MDALLAEFPSLTTLRRPAIAREPVAWALVSGVGAELIVRGIAHVALLFLGPVLFPPTQPHPEWLTTATMATAAGALAAGAVLARAGGLGAVGVYVVYELVRLAAAMPGRLLFCERSGGVSVPPVVTGCDYPSLVAEQWVVWVAIAAGALLGAALLREASGANRLLRAAGAFSLALTVLALPLGFLFFAPSVEQQNVLVAYITVANVAAAAVAGVLLARHRLAAAVLLALLIVAPPVGVGLPMALYDPSGAAETTSMTIARWSGVFIPVATAAALLLAREVARRARGTGTVS